VTKLARLNVLSLRGVLLGLLALVGASSTGACSTSTAVGRSAAPNEAFDAIVVLGHRPPVDAHGLEYETRVRVERGIALYRAGRAPRLLFTGGPSTPKTVEADVMAEYAEAHGVPAGAILRERASRDTIENARFSVALLREHLALDRAPRVLLVTSDYHLARAVRLLQCAGADVFGEAVALKLSVDERRKRERNERWVSLFYLFIAECNRAANG
jgi:uncharacterized SAM-binding protein YcdF (DUF218 family)